MESEDSLHGLYTKMIQLKKQVAALEKQKMALQHKELSIETDDKLCRFTKLVKNINDYQENINNKQTKIMYGMQDKTLLSLDNSVQLSHTHHEDFINMLKTKTILDKLLAQMQTENDKIDDITSIVNQFKDLHSSWHNEFIERLCEFRSAKGLLQNIKELRDYEKKDDSVLEQKSTGTYSDLGCYPNDMSHIVNDTEISKFATSSPISSIGSFH